MKSIKPEELQKNVFSMIGKEWLLVTAEKEGQVNTMTASWGGLGVMWGKNVAFIVLRPQRYTKEFVDAGGTFSLSVLDGGYRKTLNYLGTVSGRNEDKVAKSGLTVEQVSTHGTGEEWAVKVRSTTSRSPFGLEFRDPEGGAHTTGGYSMRNDREAPGKYEFEYILEGYPWDSARFTLSFTHTGSLDLAIPLGDS